MKYSEEQIKEWKEKHGDIFAISVDEYSCILRKPKRKDLSYVATLGKDPMKMQEVLLNQLWVEGDEEIKTNDELFLAVVSKMETVTQIKEAEIKKL